MRQKPLGFEAKTSDVLPRKPRVFGHKPDREIKNSVISVSLCDLKLRFPQCIHDHFDLGGGEDLLSTGVADGHQLLEEARVLGYPVVEHFEGILGLQILIVERGQLTLVHTANLHSGLV